MQYNYSETPTWAQPSSPQNQGYYGQTQPTSTPHNNFGPSPVSPSNTNAYYGAPNPVSPSSDNGYYVSPNAASPSYDLKNNNYPSPAISPGDWNTLSPNGPSPTQYGAYSYASPNSQASQVKQSSPSSVQSEPFMYSSAPQKLNLPRKLGGVDKTELDVGREKVAGARALCLMQQEFGTQTQSAQQPYQPAHRTVKKMDKGGRYRPKNPQWGFVNVASKEKLATSTRKKKGATAEEDFENITDFKSDLDVDRQKHAQKKALKLLSYF